MIIRPFRPFVTAVKGRTVAESNASLLEAFSQIIHKPRTGKIGAAVPAPMLRSTNSLIPAPEFNARDSQDKEIFSQEFGGPKFKPGDVLLSLTRTNCLDIYSSGYCAGNEG
jgi:hypothetical protein